MSFEVNSDEISRPVSHTITETLLSFHFIINLLLHLKEEGEGVITG